MTGLRSYTTTEPNIWRFPEWKDNTFYPVGSFVAVPGTNAFDSDSDQFTFDYYVSLMDVPGNTEIAFDEAGNLYYTGRTFLPTDDDSDWINYTSLGVKPWAITFSSTDASTIAEVLAKIDALQELFPLLGIDSDIAVLVRADSDFRVKDSEQDSDLLMEVHDRKAADSDYYVRITGHLDSEEHARKATDSDQQIQIWDNDSDILMEIHDRRAADSDYYVRVTSHLDSEEHARKSADSDLQIQIWDNDSDILMEIHDRKAADSEFDSDLTQFVHDFKAADSDIIQRFDSEIKQLRHDYQADDSEFDSDLTQFRHDSLAGDSDLRYSFDSDVKVLHVRDDSDSDRLINFIHRYEERDSDIERKFLDHDSDINFLLTNAHLQDMPGTGFPVGAIQAFASTNMPFGFQLCDGSTFSTVTYPELYNYLGHNRLPDLRNQFLRGWNDDSDGFGNERTMLSNQGDDIKTHTHDFVTPKPNPPGEPNGILAELWTETLDGYVDNTRTTEPGGGDETRPINVTVAFGIAMFSGAGIPYDSDVFHGQLREIMKDYDSDVLALYNRTSYHKQVYAPDSDLLPGSTFVASVNTDDFTDITVLLNGVLVSQWSAAGNTFTFNFVIRGNTDEVTLVLRR